MNSVKVGMLILYRLLVLMSCSRKSIHEKVLTVDTPLMLTRPDGDIGESHSSETSKVDFPPLKQGGLDAIFFAVFENMRN